MARSREELTGLPFTGIMRIKCGDDDDGVCMYVCMYVRMHVCMHVRMHACMYIYIYACMYACMYVYIFMHVCREYACGAL